MYSLALTLLSPSEIVFIISFICFLPPVNFPQFFNGLSFYCSVNYRKFRKFSLYFHWKENYFLKWIKKRRKKNTPPFIFTPSHSLPSLFFLILFQIHPSNWILIYSECEIQVVVYLTGVSVCLPTRHVAKSGTVVHATSSEHCYAQTIVSTRILTNKTWTHLQQKKKWI